MAELTKIQGGRTDVLTAAQAGRVPLLVALRDHIAGVIDDGVGPRDLAALSRHLRQLAAEIEDLQPCTSSSVVADTPDEPWPT